LAVVSGCARTILQPTKTLASENASCFIANDLQLSRTAGRRLDQDFAGLPAIAGSRPSSFLSSGMGCRSADGLEAGPVAGPLDAQENQ